MRKIVVTGGHLTPAIATIDELKKYPEIEIIFIGRARAMEGDKTPSAESVVIPNLGIKFYAININAAGNNGYPIIGNPHILR